MEADFRTAPPPFECWGGFPGNQETTKVRSWGHFTLRHQFMWRLHNLPCWCYIGYRPTPHSSAHFHWVSSKIKEEWSVEEVQACVQWSLPLLDYVWDRQPATTLMQCRKTIIFNSLTFEGTWSVVLSTKWRYRTCNCSNCCALAKLHYFKLTVLSSRELGLDFKPVKTIWGSLMKVKNSTPDDRRKGMVYSIPCRDCIQVYVGETGRTLKARYLNIRKKAAVMGLGFGKGGFQIQDYALWGWIFEK